MPNSKILHLSYFAANFVCFAALYTFQFLEPDMNFRNEHLLVRKILLTLHFRLGLLGVDFRMQPTTVKQIGEGVLVKGAITTTVSVTGTNRTAPQVARHSFIHSFVAADEWVVQEPKTFAKGNERLNRVQSQPSQTKP